MTEETNVVTANDVMSIDDFGDVALEETHVEVELRGGVKKKIGLREIPYPVYNKIYNRYNVKQDGKKSEEAELEFMLDTIVESIFDPPLDKDSKEKVKETIRMKWPPRVVFQLMEAINQLQGISPDAISEGLERGEAFFDPEQQKTET